MILLLLGLLLTVIALPVSDKKDSSPEVKSSSFFSASSEKNTDAERTVLEKKLEDLLSQTEGVGKVRVLLMTGEEKDSSSFYDSGNQAVTGVLIAAEGADNSVVSRNIVEGVMALFQLDAHKIKVMRGKVKKILKKNQVIITSLAVLIAVAGYLNFADVDLGLKNKEASADSSSILEDVDYDLTDETALLDENGADSSLTDVQDQTTSTPGEAVLTAASDFAAQAKLSREQIRSQNKADLQAIINNQDLGDDQKQEAVSTMVSMADLTEKESAAELLLEAKGFENVIVNLTGETADVVVPEADLTDAKRAQIEDIVKRKTGIAPENIVITPLNESEEELVNKDESLETSVDIDDDTTVNP